MILFLSISKFCLVFYGIYLKIFGKVSVHVLVFTLVPRFVIAVGSGRGDGAANFAELDSDFSEPGKHV